MHKALSAGLVTEYVWVSRVSGINWRHDAKLSSVVL